MILNTIFIHSLHNLHLWGAVYIRLSSRPSACCIFEATERNTEFLELEIYTKHSRPN
jgi:hypothetical protein